METKGELSREQTTIRLPTELMEKLKQAAADLGMSFNGYVLWLIDIGRQHLSK